MVSEWLLCIRDVLNLLHIWSGGYRTVRYATLHSRDSESY